MTESDKEKMDGPLKMAVPGSTMLYMARGVSTSKKFLSVLSWVTDWALLTHKRTSFNQTMDDLLAFRNAIVVDPSVLNATIDPMAMLMAGVHGRNVSDFVVDTCDEVMVELEKAPLALFMIGAVTEATRVLMCWRDLKEYARVHELEASFDPLEKLTECITHIGQVTGMADETYLEFIAWATEEVKKVGVQDQALVDQMPSKGGDGDGECADKDKSLKPGECGSCPSKACPAHPENTAKAEAAPTLPQGPFMVGGPLDPGASLRKPPDSRMN